MDGDVAADGRVGEVGEAAPVLVVVDLPRVGRDLLFSFVAFCEETACEVRGLPEYFVSKGNSPPALWCKFRPGLTSSTKVS